MKFLFTMVTLFLVSAVCWACTSGTGTEPVVSQDGLLPGEDIAETDAQRRTGQEISPPDLSLEDQEETAEPDILEEIWPETVKEDIVDLIPELPETLENDVTISDSSDVKDVEGDLDKVDSSPEIIYPPGPGCGDVFKCGLAQNCANEDESCWEECAGQADADELDKFEAISDCVLLHCSDLPEAEQGDCLIQQCLAEIYECLGGAGNEDCLVTFKCIQGCGEDDGLCLFECLEGSDQETLELIISMSSAGEMEGFALMVECAGGQGELSCGQTVGCITECEDEALPDDTPEGDPVVDCMFDCIEQSSPEGAQQMVDFIGCVDEQCPAGMEDCPGIFFCLDLCPGISF